MQVGRGPQTREKQDGYRALTSLRADVLKNIFRNPKNGWADRIDHIFDLTAGPGWLEEVGDCSPLIALEAARRHDITTRAWLIEGNPETYAELLKTLARRRFDAATHGLQIHSRCGRWEAILPDLLRQAQRGLRRPDFMYGLAYYDPTGWDTAELDALACVQRLAPRVDLALNLSATTMKRCRRALHCRDSRTLAEFLAITGKRYWLIRVVPGFQQWTILLGTSWEKFPDYRAKGFHRLESATGQAMFAKVQLTVEEHARWDQRTLFTLGGAW